MTSLLPAGTSAPDPICAAAVDAALAAVMADAGPESVANHLGVAAADDRMVTHQFRCTLPGYHGWQWEVTVARAPRSRRVTINEVALIPGPEALTAPRWVPWSQRIQPGDLSPGALAPTDPREPRLAPGWSGADDLAGQLEPGPLHPVNWEPFLQRSRVPSLFGRESAATRWYRGENGPDNAMTRSAPGACGSCGWLLTIGGPLGQAFGVCTNRLSSSDGAVVSFEHGCGAHSEAMPLIVHGTRSRGALDELTVDEFDLGHS
jgi:hypothetical protein